MVSDLIVPSSYSMPSVGFGGSVEAYIYIYHLGLLFNLPTLPESLQDSLPISFSSDPVLARTAPQITYSSAGPRTLQVNLKMHRQMFCIENDLITVSEGVSSMIYTDPSTGKDINVDPKDAMDYFIDAMTTLSLPKFTESSRAITPPSLLIRFGNESCISGVPSNFTKTATGPWLKNGKLADVTISFTVTETDPFSASYTAKNGTLRVLSNTLSRGSIWM